jgi:hypothetical protein
MAGRPIALEWRKSIQKNGIGPRMFIDLLQYSESGLTGNIIVGLDSQSIIQLKLMLKRDKEDKGTRL